MNHLLTLGGFVAAYYGGRAIQFWNGRHERKVKRGFDDIADAVRKSNEKHDRKNGGNR